MATRAAALNAMSEESTVWNDPKYRTASTSTIGKPSGPCLQNSMKPSSTAGM